MPSLVQRNTNFWLACQFELHNQDQLYSVKWYRNNEEFYRLQFSSDQQLANGSEPSVLASIGSTSTTNSDLWQPKTAGGQQQYFAQSGLNVLVSLAEINSNNIGRNIMPISVFCYQEEEKERASCQLSSTHSSN